MFNIVTIFGVALLSPLVISIGVLCGIPISISEFDFSPDQIHLVDHAQCFPITFSFWSLPLRSLFPLSSSAIDIVFRGRAPTPGFLVGTTSLVTSVLLVYFHEFIRDLWRKRLRDGKEVEAEEEEVPVHGKIEPE